MVLESTWAVDPQVVAKLLIAVALGGLIGIEREMSHRPAGLRTHMLVALGAAIFGIMSILFNLSPDRIASNVVTGIGFLGAGSIIALRGHIQGVTTAATLWVVASIGLAVGLGQFTMAIIAAVIIFGILQIKRVEEKFEPDKKRSVREYF